MQALSTTVPTLPCLCASLRRAARALNGVYEEALRTFGLTGSQFTILQALNFMGECTQGELGRVLSMDSTTLTRTLGIMKRHGWVARRAGKDRREWRLSLGSNGREVYRRALPAWERAQRQFQEQLGPDWKNLMQLADRVTSAVAESGGSK